MRLHSVRERSAGLIGAIVFGSDQGLVGQFNEAMAEFVARRWRRCRVKRKSGRSANAFRRVWQTPVFRWRASFPVPSSVNAITSLVGQLEIASEAQGDGGCAEVHVFHTKPTSGALCEPVSQRLLPLDAQWQKDLANIRWPTKILPELFGQEEATLRAFVREYLFISLFKACAESLASENASRLAAMQRAEKNIDSLLTNLNRTFYRLRQSSIDEELFDVISGFNALSSLGSNRGNKNV